MSDNQPLTFDIDTTGNGLFPFSMMVRGYVTQHDEIARRGERGYLEGIDALIGRMTRLWSARVYLEGIGVEFTATINGVAIDDLEADDWATFVRAVLRNLRAEIGTVRMAA